MACGARGAGSPEHGRRRGRPGASCENLPDAPETQQPETRPLPRDSGAPVADVPVPLLDTSQPRELEPRESEVAEAPLLDRADPAAEQRSSRSRRSSKSLDVERASLFWASEGSSRFGDRRRRSGRRWTGPRSGWSGRRHGTQPPGAGGSGGLRGGCLHRATRGQGAARPCAGPSRARRASSAMGAGPTVSVSTVVHKRHPMKLSLGASHPGRQFWGPCEEAQACSSPQGHGSWKTPLGPSRLPWWRQARARPGSTLTLRTLEPAL